MSDDKEYEVGYGKPPRHARFKLGQSGNPKGRPRKPRRALIPSQSWKDVLAVGETLVIVRSADGGRPMPMSKAILLSLGNKAAQGDVKCIKLWAELYSYALRENLAANPEFDLIDTFERYIEDRGYEVLPLTRWMLDRLARRSRTSF